MTHSLYREGTRESQEGDYVWLLYHSKGINDENIEERYRTAIDIVEECGSENWGDVKTGPIVTTDPARIKEHLSGKSRLRGVFTRKQQVVEFLRRMKEADLGLSVIVTGVLDEVYDACRESGVEPHTVNYFVDVFGRRELLADEKTLAHTTMCGHHMVPDGYVDNLREKVRKGRMPPEKAALEMASFCPCGIFNQIRSMELLREEAEADASKTGPRGEVVGQE